MLPAAWLYSYSLDITAAVVVGVLLFALLIFLGEAFPIGIGSGGRVGVWDIGLVVAVAALGPTWAAVAALPSAIYAGRKEWLRLLFEVSHIIVITYLAGLVFNSVSSPLLSEVTASPVQLAYGTVAAGLVVSVSNKAIMMGLLRVKYGRPASETWHEDMVPYLSSDALNIITATVGVLALVIYGPVAAVVVVTGAIGSQVLVFRSREQARENEELKERVRSLEESLAASNSTFGLMIIGELGQHDGYTHRHAAATAVYARDIASEMGLDEVTAGKLRMAGLLHNVGLFGMDRELLAARGKLNSVAHNELSEHPMRSEKALAGIPEFAQMARWVRWHHERVDGRGYPDRLRGDWLPLESKILAVSQAYAAMILDSPHRPGLEYNRARDELARGIDTQFDGPVVRAFLRVLDSETEGYRMADDARFIFPENAIPELPETPDSRAV